MGLPNEPREGEYSWDYLDWSPCMAQCGDSFQVLYIVTYTYNSKKTTL